MQPYVCACVRACVRRVCVCVRACARVRGCVCVRAHVCVDVSQECFTTFCCLCALFSFPPPPFFASPGWNQSCLGALFFILQAAEQNYLTPPRA